MAVDRTLVEDIARQLFDCLRNAHLCLARSDTAAARANIDEARALHRRLATIAHAEPEGDVGIVLVGVIGERIEGVAALVRQNRRT